MKEDTPFDEIEINLEMQKEVDKMSGVSSTKAKKKEGFFVSGQLYQNKTTNIVKHLCENKDTENLFRLNEWMQRIEYTRTPFWDENTRESKAIDDNDALYIKAWLADKYYYEPSVTLIQEALFLVASKQKIHPVKKYLESLMWDRKERLDTWLSKVCKTERNIYISSVGRKMICAMVKRIYQPGCQFDNLIVLEGRQGIYKTTMLRILGGKWYAPFSIKAESKDAVDVMQGKWLLEMEELTSMRYGDIEHIKAFLSRTVDRVRLSYRRNAQDFPRQCVFIGTMNPVGDNQYFRDPSENRRFWPLECAGMIEINWLKEYRDQLFAEAMQMYKEENLFLDNEEAIRISVEKQDDRKPRDNWVDLIDEYIMGKNIVSTIEVLTKCLHVNLDKITHANSCRVGVCMRQLGWLPKRCGPKQKRYYIRPNADINDINNWVEERKELWDD